MRLIDADAIDTKYSDPEVIETLEEAPTIDAVPVVRCRECHWFCPGENDAEVWTWCILRKCDTDPHGYCHLAIRREDGDK